MKTCWEFTAEHRPRFSELVIELSYSLGSMADYLALEAERDHQPPMDINYAAIF